MGLLLGLTSHNSDIKTASPTVLSVTIYGGFSMDSYYSYYMDSNYELGNSKMN